MPICLVVYTILLDRLDKKISQSDDLDLQQQNFWRQH
jgi:hypothetical protein